MCGAAAAAAADDTGSLYHQYHVLRARRGERGGVEWWVLVAEDKKSLRQRSEIVASGDKAGKAEIDAPGTNETAKRGRQRGGKRGR